MSDGAQQIRHPTLGRDEWEDLGAGGSAGTAARTSQPGVENPNRQSGTSQSGIANQHQQSGAGSGGSVQNGSSVPDPIAQCLAIVERFRTAAVTKPVAIGEIIAVLGATANADAADYIAMLDDTQRDQTLAENRGTGIVAGAMAQRQLDKPSEAVGPPRDDAHEPGSREPPRKRKAVVDPDDGDDDDATEEKRVETEYAFYVSRDDVLVTDPAAAETLRRKTIYMGKDGSTKRAKAYLRTTYDRPEFPDSLLDFLLSNAYVDLDKVYSAIFSHGTNHTQLGQIGDLQLTYGAVDTTPTRRVTNLGDWTIAWGRYAPARIHAYPNQASELRRYQEWITSMFTAVGTGNAGVVIRLDKAIRTMCGSTNDKRLDKFEDFGHLVTQYVTSVGAGSSKSSGGGVSGGGAGRSRDGSGGAKPICRKWNAGNCDLRRCTFQHVCSGCGSDAHGESRCGQSGSGGKAQAK